MSCLVGQACITFKRVNAALEDKLKTFQHSEFKGCIIYFVFVLSKVVSLLYFDFCRFVFCHCTDPESVYAALSACARTVGKEIAYRHLANIAPKAVPMAVVLKSREFTIAKVITLTLNLFTFLHY